MGFGLKATCHDVKSFRGVNLIKTMKEKLESFPVGEFNNFYQYSMAVLALFVNDIAVSEKYGNQLVQYLSRDKRRTGRGNTCVSDTECMAIIALSGLLKQKRMSRTFVEVAKTIVRNSVLDIDGQVERGEITNLVTLAHALQVLQIH